MAQSDQTVQNATFPTVRADINDNLAALYSQSSGNSAPTVTVAFQPWVDTSSNPPVWKVRNGSNSAWITVGVLNPAGFNVGGITAIANGGTGATTAALALTALLPNQTGNAGKALVTSGSAASWTTVNAITRDTAVASTSGTSIDFISIPSTAKRITVMFDEVSTDGASNPIVQIGDSGGIEVTGYAGATGFIGVSSTANSYSTGFLLNVGVGASTTMSGMATLFNISGNQWVFGLSAGYTNGAFALSGGGGKILSGTLDRVRITTVNGTDTFDAGSINILYEG